MVYWIVVVDDEAISLTNAKIILKEEKMRVSCLKSGADLLKFVEKNTPDLIILDVLMPQMDGFETFNRLRQYENDMGRSHIPVIFLTGENDSETEQKGLYIGASDFVHKPFNKDILIRRIENTIKNNKTIEMLTEEAMIDKLTGFYNKNKGTERISKLCSRKTGVLAILDLDNFKLVNDLFGHDMGDRVLTAVSDIIKSNVRETDTICRIGGDEFMLFLEDLTEEHIIASLSERLNTQLSAKAVELMGEDHGIPLGLSTGAVMIPEHGRDYEELFSMADNALYFVKQNGKHGFNIFKRLYSEDESGVDGLEHEIERITMIVEERNESGGALMLGREAFSMIYRFILRFYKRYGGCCVRILFSINMKEDGKEKELPDIVSQLGQFLQHILRKSDLILQNRSNQFFVLLTERTKFEAEAVIERIVEEWKKSGYGKDAELNYAFRSVEYKNEKNG